MVDPYLKMRKYEDKDGLHQIQILYSKGGEVLKLDTNVKTMPIYWTGLLEGVKKKNAPKIGRVSSRCQEIDQDQNKLNIRLKKAENDLNKILEAFRQSHHFDPDITYVKKEYNKDEQKISSDPEVKNQLRSWIPRKEKDIKKNTLKIYLTLLHDLINMGLSNPIKNWRKVSEVEFEELLKKSKPIYFREIDKVFKNKYLTFLEKNGCQNPTINKRFDALKAFLNAMVEDSVNEYTDFQKFKVHRPEVNQEVIIPSPEQFNTLVSTRFKSERLEYARSLFVLSCVSGLRYSDIMQIEEPRIHDSGTYQYLRIIQRKTKKEVSIPLHPIGFEILERYNKTITKISNQKLNVALKEVFKDLEFNDIVTVYEIYGAEDPIPKNLKKWELMRFHSGRRFFCTMLVNGYEGFRINFGNVKMLSGHSSAVLEQYVKSGEKIEEEMLKLFSGFVDKSGE